MQMIITAAAMCIGALRPITLFITCFVLTSSIGHSNHSMYEECEIDENCPKGHYCYVTDLCVKCTNCTVYRREKSTWTECPKKALDCGECIKGYESEILDDGKKPDSCKIIKKTKIDSDIASYFFKTLITYGAITIIVIVILIIVSYFLHKYFKKRSSQISLRNEPETVPFSCEDVPPPYSPFVNASAPYSIEVTSPATHEHVEEFTSESLLKAVPFSPPNYVNGNVSHNVQEPVEEEEEEEDLEIVDENTQPSDWRPEASAETTPESLLSSSLVPERPFQHLNMRDSGSSSALSLASTTSGDSSNKDNDTGYDSNPDGGPRNKRARTMMNLNLSFTINSSWITQNQNSSNAFIISQDDEDLS